MQNGVPWTLEQQRAFGYEKCTDVCVGLTKPKRYIDTMGKYGMARLGRLCIKYWSEDMVCGYRWSLNMDTPLFLV